MRNRIEILRGLRTMIDSIGCTRYASVTQPHGACAIQDINCIFVLQSQNCILQIQPMDCMLVDDSNACALRLPIQPYPSRPAVDYSVKTLSQLRPVLRGFRVAAGLTQAMVAARLGITQQSYAQFEANPAAAGVERLFKVLRLLNAGITLTQDDAQTPARAT